MNEITRSEQKGPYPSMYKSPVGMSYFVSGAVGEMETIFKFLIS